MNKFILTAFFLPFAFSVSFAQEYVLTVYVKYGFKKSQIIPEVQVNLGEEDINHPLFGKLKNSGEECVAVKPNGTSEEIICNEVDLFEYLLSNSWILVSSAEVKVLSNSYTQYIFKYDHQ
ncbi:hypothetical protein [Parvicella tangerina]|uniref:Uncharacterized protein n=1 Tax=Parvicella tangerina TaxID=2829795 RepID=A0A916JNT8_9FLAO|nr:hypothetical protein [Parvicella tangerina]CAG5083365.1 hypothetical protein CRYO30217_02174 [Parvicella tangerina]